MSNIYDQKYTLSSSSSFSQIQTIIKTSSFSSRIQIKSSSGDFARIRKDDFEGVYKANLESGRRAPIYKWDVEKVAYSRNPVYL